MNPKLEAQANFFRLENNPYPGRGLVIGRDKTGKHLVQVYWIMGRSENSRNRVFGAEGGRLFTEAADPAKVKDPSLIIYNAMAEYGMTPTGEHGMLFVVSNGDQTDTLISGARRGHGFSRMLANVQYEPDAPNFTPRICGACSLDGSPLVVLAILRKSPWGDSCDRSYYHYGEISPGFGYCLTTYSGDGNPLPAFRGEPLLMPFYGNIEETAEDYWGMLNKENRVALAVKFIDASGKSSVCIVNRYEKSRS